jgi:hypothetical protein
MRAPRLPIVLLGFSLATTQAAAAEPIDTTGAMQCEASGFSIDPDPKGTNLRSAPRANAPVVGRLAPRTRITPVEVVGVTFDIVASKDKWLLIRNGNPEKDFMLDPANAADGRGWVSGKLVGTTLGAAALRTAPKRDAPFVVDLSGPGLSPESTAVSAIHGCQGRYVEVTAAPLNGKTVRGWSWAPCSLQLTPCDRGGMRE